MTTLQHFSRRVPIPRPSVRSCYAAAETHPGFSPVIPLIKRESTGSTRGRHSRIGIAIYPDPVSIGPYLDLGLYLYRNPQRQLRHAHRRAGVVAGFWAVEL